MNNREAHLDRVRRSLGSAYLPGSRPDLPARTLSPAAVSLRELAETFVAELTAVGGEAHRPEKQSEAIETVIALLREAGGDEILAWPDEELLLPDLGAAIRTAGLKVVEVAIPAEAVERKERLAELDRPLAGLTGALAGLADTGSLALLSGSTRPRAASLLPLVHVAVLPVQKLLPSMAHFFAAYPDVTRDASNLVFVTGPSRTADIEMVITRGVHGPRRLHVVLVD